MSSPLHARSTCTEAPARGRCYSQTPSCGGTGRFPVMVYLLPVYTNTGDRFALIENLDRKFEPQVFPYRYRSDITQVIISSFILYLYSRCISHLRVLQRPQVQQVDVARQRRVEWLERAELWQLAVAGSNHGHGRVAEGEGGQVGKQRQVINWGSSHFLSEQKHNKTRVRKNICCYCRSSDGSLFLCHIENFEQKILRVK